MGAVSRPGRAIGSAQPRLRAWMLPLTALVLCLLVMAQAVPAVLRCRDVFPFWDMIVVDYRYFAGPARDFWILHDNDHLPIFVMPLFWLDLTLFRGQGIFLVACNLLLSVLIGLAPAAALYRADINAALRAAVCAMLAATMLWLGNHVNLVWPKQLHMYVSLACVVAAIAVAAPMPRDSVRRAAAAALLLTMATFSFGYGIIGFPALLGMGLARRWTVRPLLLLGLVLAACLALYLALQTGLLGGAAAAPRPHALVAPFLYGLTFLASPWLNLLRTLMPLAMARDISWCLAAAGIGVYLWRAWQWRTEPPTELGAWALALALFTMFTAAQTSLGRSIFGVMQAADGRYIIGQLPFWAGLVLLGAEASGRTSRAHTPRWQPFSAMLAATAGLLLLSQQAAYQDMRAQAHARWQAAMAAIDGVQDAALDRAINPVVPFEVPVVVQGLRAQRWGMFAWRQARWLGQRLASFGAPERGCLGAFDALRPTEGDTGWIAEGWAAHTDDPGAFGWVLLADAAGRVAGIGHVSGRREDVAAALHDRAMLYTGWTGYVPRGMAAGEVTAYLLRRGQQPCRLGALPAASLPDRPF